MKFKLLIFVLLTIVSADCFSQKNTVNLISSSENETVLTFKMNDFNFITVNTSMGNEKIIISDGLSPLLDKGSPDIPKFTTPIILPDKGNTKIELISSEYYEIENIKLAPSKGNLKRDIDPSKVPYEYGKVYSDDAFFPASVSNGEKPYILRDYRGQSIHVYPFTYNPVKDVLRVYTEISVKVIYLKEKGENELSKKRSMKQNNREYKQIYSKHFLNYADSKYTSVEEEGNMLIICYDDWVPNVQALSDWKNTTGRPCELITVSDAGGTTAGIKNYVENYYNTKGLTYLLLVGDASQVPTNSGGGLGGDSDNAYAYIAGDDHYPEFFVGRFSAENAAHVETQVLRTIEYEKGNQLTDGWLNKCMSIASNEGPGDENEYDYDHLRNIQTDLLGFTYQEPPYEFFEGSQGEYDAVGNPNSSDVTTGLNSGTGIINYTGHGSEFSWGTSGFSVANINNLVNENKLPFIFDVACVNGDFVGLTCFGEAWLRAENNGEPTGAIAIAASTINQSWEPPMSAQDEMVDLLVGASSYGTKRTFGGLLINGCLLMNDKYSDFAMTDTWTCFGDPSLYVRTDDPVAMTVDHSNELTVGVPNFNVLCDHEGAFATLSRDGEIVGSAVVSGGTASIPVSEVVPGETLRVAVVGFNKITYLQDISSISPTGPYVVVDTYVNEIDYGRTIDLDIVLENVGQNDATGISVTVSASDPNVSVTNENFSYGDILAGALSSKSTGAFTLTVNDDLVDQYQVPVNITISDDNKTLWEHTKYVKVNAPAISIGDIFITNDDNSDGILDPGETGDLNFTITNSGHKDADFSGTLAEISDPGNYLTLGGISETGISIAAGSSVDFVYNGASADADTPLGSTVKVEINISAGTNGQYTLKENQEFKIGIYPVHPISNEGILTVCSGTFYDSGLDTEQYGNNEAYTMTFLPVSDEDAAVIEFTSFKTETGYDYLYIYDGPDTSSPLIGTYHGTNSPGTVIGNNGLTFKFASDGYVTDDGWSADISCSEKISVEEIETKFMIIPNPSSGTFMIDFGRSYDGEKNVKVFSLSGQTVYSAQVNDNTHEIDLSDLTKGVYFINIISDKRTYSDKVILK